jgi:hypothetical protein
MIPDVCAHPPVVYECMRCRETGRICPSCVQRRRHAWTLVNRRGHSVEQAAEILKLPPRRVRALVEQEADRRELRSLKCDSIPVALTRAVIDEALARDPHLTLADIARWVEMRQVDFERAFLGRSKHGPPKQRVNVASASRLMLALGRAPYELPGC